MVPQVAVKWPGESTRIVPIKSEAAQQPILCHAERYAADVWSGECFLRHTAGPHVGKPVFFRLANHHNRLEESRGILEFLESPCSAEEQMRIRFSLAALNAPIGHNYMSMMFGTVGGIGVMPKDLRTKLVVVTDNINPRTRPYLTDKQQREGLTIRISEREPKCARDASALSCAKTAGNYNKSNIVKFRAMKAGADDGILWDPHMEYIAELSVMGLVLLTEDGGGLVPALETMCLNSITIQSSATLLCEALDVPVERTCFGPEVFSKRKVRAAFGGGTANGWAFIRRFVSADRQVVWECTDREAEEFVRQGAETYQDYLRGDGLWSGLHPEWFTPVPEEILRLPQPLVYA